MKKLFILLCLVLACVYCFAQDSNNEDEVVKIDRFNQRATKEGELIVKFADNTTFQLQNNNRGTLQSTGLSRVDALLQQYPVARAERLCPNDDPNRQLKTSKAYNGPDVVERDLSRLCRFVMEDPMQTYQMMEALNELDEVEFAEPNYLAFALGEADDVFNAIGGVAVPDGDEPKSGGYHNTYAYTHQPFYSLQWGVRAVHLPELWAADNNNNSDRAVIAILDTGVDIDHPDLAANIWTNPGETDNGFDDDNNGFVDDLHGWDFVNQTADMHDFNSHGTHCAGIAAAVGDNNIGITGANPKAYIMPVAVLQSNGYGDVATIIQGVNYAKNNGADVISMSFGSYGYSIAFEQALAQAYQNCVLVAAAGNDGKHIDPRCCQDGMHYILDMPMFPGALSFVLGVEATQQTLGYCAYTACWSNTDCDGPSFSQYGEEKLYNYELQAPGASIYSTIPNGGYRYFNGTSMSTPLVAGGISALLHAKPYSSQEMLWGDLINTSGNHVNFLACYNAGIAPAQLQCVTYEMNDTIAGDGDYRPDAGETIDFYPTIRSTWGATDDITIWLTVDQFESPDIVTFLDTEPVEFGWSLSAYGKNKSQNPVRFTINPDCVDGRYIKLELHATTSNALEELEFPFTIQVENGVELEGFTDGNVTLTANHNYVIHNYYAVPIGDTLTIEPGTVLHFDNNARISVGGYAIAHGTPDSLITFTKGDLAYGWGGFYGNIDMKYCQIDNISVTSWNGSNLSCKNMENCILRDNVYTRMIPTEAVTLSNIFYNQGQTHRGIDNPPFETGFGGSQEDRYNNHIGNHVYTYNESEYTWVENSSAKMSNVFNNSTPYRSCSFMDWHDLPEYVHYFQDSIYLGASAESNYRREIYDANTYGSVVFGYFLTDKIMNHPVREAHGIVWKVLVNGYDAQDEFEQLPPLGCGKHEFKVYFNRAMDTLVKPMLTMGVRPPYTQHAIAEDGHWSTDRTIYTACITINGTTATDGLNRVYVANARDNEHFEIPVENTRFNVQVSSAGSLSSEFMATPGLGKVELEWNNNEVDFDDFLGYNMYRYTIIDTLGHHSDTLLLNTSLIQDTLFTDFDVLPGQRYYYYYKVLRSSLTESEASLTVTTVPLTSIPGDANGSMAVDVADVVSIVSYLTNGNPQPFIFEAADVNSDGNIDILDIVGVINIITNRGGLPDANPVATAYYSIENGILFVDTPVELGGVQFVLNGVDSQNIEVLQALDGFEQVRADVSDGTLFMAYSMSGKRLTAGKHALLYIGEGTVNSVALADPEGRNVLVILSGTGVEEHETLFLEQPYPNPFNGNLTIPFIIADERANNVVFTVTNMMGQTISVIELGSRSRGEYKYEWRPATNMPTGIYTVSMQVNGRNVQRAKVVYVK